MAENVHKLGIVVLHTLLIYVFLITMIRIFGRRQLGQLTLIDLVIILILGSAVETDMIAGNVSLEAGLVSATTLLLANRLFAIVLPRFKRLRSIVAGSPVLLVHNGQFVDEHLCRIGMTRADVQEAIRQHEKADVSQVRYAVLESDGTLSLIPMDAQVLTTAHGTNPDERSHPSKTEKKK